MSHERVTAAGLSALFVLLAPTASFAEEQEPTVIHYEAPAECPLQKEYERQLFLRTKRLRIAADGEHSRTFGIRIHKGQRRYDGELTIDAEGEERTTRAVHSDSCETAVAALALISALAADPHASTVPAEALPVALAPSAEPAEPRLDPGPIAIDPPAANDRLPPPLPAPRLSRFTVALDGGVDFARAPRGAGFVGPAVGLDLPGISPYPSIRLGAFASPPRGRNVANVSADFSSWVAELDACPATLVWHDVLLRPCAVGQLGALVADGHAPRDSQSVTRLWATVGAGAHLRLLLPKSFFVAATYQVLVTVRQDDFYFDRSLVIFTPPRLAFSEALEVGAYFR